MIKTSIDFLYNNQIFHLTDPAQLPINIYKELQAFFFVITVFCLFILHAIL